MLSLLRFVPRQSRINIHTTNRFLIPRRLSSNKSCSLDHMSMGEKYLILSGDIGMIGGTYCGICTIKEHDHFVPATFLGAGSFVVGGLFFGILWPIALPMYILKGK